MKQNALSDSAVSKESIVSANKLCYEKDGVSVFSMKMSDKFCAYAFAVEINGETENVIVCNGKLTRSERRKVVKGGLLCFKFDYLTTSEFLANMCAGDVRGVVLQFKNSEKKESAK